MKNKIEIDALVSGPNKEGYGREQYYCFHKVFDTTEITDEIEEIFFKVKKEVKEKLQEADSTNKHYIIHAFAQIRAELGRSKNKVTYVQYEIYSPTGIPVSNECSFFNK